MTDPIEKLREYGYELPAPKAPVASYVPVTRSGNLLYVSGQISSSDSGVVQGRLGDTMNVVQGGNAAELAAINVLSQVVHMGGIPLHEVKKVLKLTVLVASTPEFNEQHLVANGASNLIVGILGDKGKHARAAFGVASLPLGAAVEIEAIFEV
ncbi:MAG: RidA family protein [Devosia sp.]|jgi:enamine deaminase RidA (YjgF/YER057c/UK114 family)|uniref:RidA family protein n=1 Tax=unclassified Devosia TaxID=196773 RepID=UPI0019EB6227|nr:MULTISPECIES: RidA family protein [unclassified Devosia]MBF0678364.1 RidA family protein [Devosia sp.]WEJ31615.1 RidA family protein [Devosia sp. SD17-2]